jgi:hypothetical protein
LLRQRSLVYPKAKELCDTLMKTANVFDIDFFDTLKHESVILLIFLVPETFSEILFDRFFSQESSTIDKVFLISTTSKGLLAILGSQKKSKIFKKLLDQIDQENDQLFSQKNQDHSQKFCPFEFDVEKFYKSQSEDPETLLQADPDQTSNGFPGMTVVKETRYPSYKNRSARDPKTARGQDYKKIVQLSYTEKVINRLTPIYLTIMVRFFEATQQSLAKFFNEDITLTEKLFELMSVIILTSKNHGTWFTLAESAVEYSGRCLGMEIKSPRILKAVINSMLTICQNANPNVVRGYPSLCEKLGKVVQKIGQLCLKEIRFEQVQPIAGFLVGEFEKGFLSFDIKI